MLRHGRNALRQAYLENGNASALLRGHSRLLDQTLIAIWRLMALPAALVTVGGYGRKQLFPGSDIDLLILLPITPVASPGS